MFENLTVTIVNGQFCAVPLYLTDKALKIRNGYRIGTITFYDICYTRNLRYDTDQKKKTMQIFCNNLIIFRVYESQLEGGYFRDYRFF